MTRLAERAREWEAEWLRQGIAQGIERGRRAGIEQGIERGLADERELLRRQAARKFEAGTARRLARRLEVVTDSARLAEVGDWIIDCETGAELLERMGAA